MLEMLHDANLNPITLGRPRGYFYIIIEGQGHIQKHIGVVESTRGVIYLNIYWQNKITPNWIHLLCTLLQ